MARTLRSISLPALVWCLTNTYTFAAIDFGRRVGASDEHIPQWICKERATTPPPKRRAALRVALRLAGASLLSRSSIAADTLPPSRLAPGQFQRNECIAISETPHQLACNRHRQSYSSNHSRATDEKNTVVGFRRLPADPA